MPRHPGFSRVEVVIVLLILVTLAGIVTSGIQLMRAAAARMSCSNTQKQLGMGIHAYNDATGQLPSFVDQGENAPTGDGLPSAFFNIEPFLEQGPVTYRPNWAPIKYHAHSSVAFEYGQKDPKEPNGTRYGGAINRAWSLYHCPADPTSEQKLRDIPITLPNGTSGYYATGNYAVNALLPWGIPRKFKFSSETILFAERPQICQTATGETVYNLWGVGFYSPQMPAFAATAPAGSPESWNTGQIAPVFPLTDGGNRVRIGRADATPVAWEHEPAFRRIVAGEPCDPRLPGAWHRSGMQALMGDGSVRSYSYDTTPWVFWAACQPGNQP